LNKGRKSSVSAGAYGTGFRKGKELKSDTCRGGTTEGA